MAGYVSMKMKRKDLDEVNDEFSDFSLSSPARKIRRLDAELPPILEEEEAEIPTAFEQPMPEQNFAINVEQEGGPMVEELPTLPEKEERAIVLFKPMNTAFLQSPSNFSVLVNSNIISGFKNQVLWASQSNQLKASEDEAAKRDKNFGATNECLAVVPWVPSQIPPTSGAEVPQTDLSELEAEDMDIEDNVGAEQRHGNEFGGVSVSDSLHQWQQQYCMIPQPPQNTSTPIVWYR